jgi:hypothetical protein
MDLSLCCILKQEMPPKVSSHAVACVARDKCISHRIIVSMQYCRTEVAPQQERTCHRKKLAFEDGRLAALRVQKLHHLFTETLGKIFEVGHHQPENNSTDASKNFPSVLHNTHLSAQTKPGQSVASTLWPSIAK